MNASVVHVALSLRAGGAEKLVMQLAQLAPQGPSPVICTDERGQWAELLEAEGIPVYALGRQPGFQPRLAKEIHRLARRHQARVLHCHQYTPFVYGGLGSFGLPRMRVIYTEHGRFRDGPVPRRRRYANRILHRMPDRVVAVSASLRDDLIEEGIPAERIAVIRNGVPLGDPPTPMDKGRARKAMGIDPKALVAGTVATLRPVKHLHQMVAAIAKVRASVPDAQLVLIGEGPLRGALQEQAESLGVHGAVHFLGHREDARALLAGFDVFVNSSRHEGVSLTILEAMDAGLPVVATQVGGNPEVVVSGETGLLVPRDEPTQLAAAIVALLRDPIGRLKLGRGGRARAQEAFSLEGMIARYAETYAELGAAIPPAPRASRNTSP